MRYSPEQDIVEQRVFDEMKQHMFEDMTMTTEQDKRDEIAAKTAMLLYGSQLFALLAAGNWHVGVSVCEALLRSIRALELIDLQRKQEERA